MRFLLLLLAIGLAESPTLAEAAGPRGLQRDRDQNAAYRAMQEGRILSLPEIRARIRLPGGEFIGAEFDGRVYRLKYMRGADVIWIDVDARTGRVLGRQ